LPLSASFVTSIIWFSTMPSLQRFSYQLIEPLEKFRHRILHWSCLQLEIHCYSILYWWEWLISPYYPITILIIILMNQEVNDLVISDRTSWVEIIFSLIVSMFFFIYIKICLVVIICLLCSLNVLEIFNRRLASSILPYF